MLDFVPMAYLFRYVTPILSVFRPLYLFEPWFAGKVAQFDRDYAVRQRPTSFLDRFKLIFAAPCHPIHAV